MNLSATKRHVAALIAIFLALHAAPAMAATSGMPFSGVLHLIDIAMPAPGPGSDWFSGDVWHVRGAQVQDAVTGDHVGGTLDRTVSFNLDGSTGESTAWCSYVWRGEVDTWRGSCRGSLLSGTFNGRGVGGTILTGSYELAPGGTAAIGPYVVSGHILDPGGPADG